jgi:hypothetical protein
MAALLPYEDRILIHHAVGHDQKQVRPPLREAYEVVVDGDLPTRQSLITMPRIY